MQTEQLRTTPLHGEHVALGARMMPFGGFDMPVQYSGIIDEHMAVRRAAGLFDVSHMGEVMVTGAQATAFVQHLVTNDASKLYDGRAMYAAMCQPDGGIVDDLIVYRFSETRYMLVINASNVETDFAWMADHNPMGAALENVSDRMALLAIQGPAATGIVRRVMTGALPEIAYYHAAEVAPADFLGMKDIILSHTGYTGEPGLEIYCRNEDAVALWRALLQEGQADGLKPAGLGARDTLRLESGFCLYGNDIDATTTPLEAGLGWITKLDKPDFVGAEALRRQKAAGVPRRLIGFVMEERSVPRHGYPVLNDQGVEIGIVTSGTQSPVLGTGVGLGYVVNDPAYTAPGAVLAVLVRDKPRRAVVKKPPFHKH
ncbi:MAG: glycine cleavage system aminomethyltransferase GcvT [Rhodothermales bacterium]|nr:glycine cleavage system aminomethyltransferase GcvT [Rhodothermales bacterium]